MNSLSPKPVIIQRMETPSDRVAVCFRPGEKECLLRNCTVVNIIFMTPDFMSYFSHFYNVCLKIITERYPYSRWQLLRCYLLLMGKSIIYHKIDAARKQKRETEFKTTLFKYTVYFTSYPQLINLIEEIFVFQVYRFASDNPRPLIVDCGSHLGISILYFKLLYPQAKLLGFEPHPDTFRLLETNIKQNNLSDVSIHNMALSDVSGKRPFYTTLLVNSLNASLMAKNRSKMANDVDVRRLSDFIETPIDLLKLDVEGSETEIILELIGRDKVKHVKNIVLEYHPDAASNSLGSIVSELTSANFMCRHNLDIIHPGARESMLYCQSQIIESTTL